ncbi:MAG: RelA/SpoT family protein [Rikenellaceae bacterium]
MENSAEDERILDDAWKKLSASCAKVCKSEEDWNLIKRAYFLAKEAHQGVRRRSGEPYLLHPIAVAHIVLDEIGLGVQAVVASLLHDVVEDTDYTVEDMDRIFGAKIASMIDGLTKMSGVFNADTSQQAEYFRKVLLTLSDDVRVILIKIADRLHNMRTLGSMPSNKQIKITSETIYLFAPLAYRLGLFTIKSELEDLCMKYRFPTEYAEIEAKLNATKSERDEFIESFTTPIIETLDRSGIKYSISGRVKSAYSIWNKMQRKGVTFEEIYDLFAVRIVFEPVPFPTEKTQCWQLYSLITDIYAPNPERLRDWISIPKDNGYEALHVTVMGPGGVWVEVQVRTKRMDEIAERGFAAHWKYKQEGASYEDDEFDKWLKKIRAALNSPTTSAVEFLDNFKMSLYTSEIVVFTPKGESRKLPNNATAIDFAYDIHSNVGNKAIGAKINHKIQPITTKINSGDQIEIITADSGRPSPEWLEYVSTSKASQAIKAFLKSETENNIERGKVIFERRMNHMRIPVSGRVLRKVIPAYGLANKDEFYSKLGAGIVTLENLDKILKENSQMKILKFWTFFINNSSKKKGDGEDGDDDENEDGVAPLDQQDRMDVESTVSPDFVIAECCMPIPGDPVVGYRNTANNTIEVHKSTCNELHRLAAQFGQNIVKEEIKWTHQKSVSYLCRVAIRGIDRVGLLLDLAQVVSCDSNINIREVNIHSHDGIFEGTFSLYVRDSESLNIVLAKVRAIKGFESVARIDV